MTNEDRLSKLEQAQKLIREVEFSYPIGDPTRQKIYAMVVNTFSFVGCLNGIMIYLRDTVRQNKMQELYLEKIQELCQELNAKRVDAKD